MHTHFHEWQTGEQRLMYFGAEQPQEVPQPPPSPDSPRTPEDPEQRAQQAMSQTEQRRSELHQEEERTIDTLRQILDERIAQLRNDYDALPMDPAERKPARENLEKSASVVALSLGQELSPEMVPSIVQRAREARSSVEKARAAGDTNQEESQSAVYRLLTTVTATLIQRDMNGGIHDTSLADFAVRNAVRNDIASGDIVRRMGGSSISSLTSALTGELWNGTPEALRPTAEQQTQARTSAETFLVNLSLSNPVVTAQMQLLLRSENPQVQTSAGNVLARTTAGQAILQRIASETANPQQAIALQALQRNQTNN